MVKTENYFYDNNQVYCRKENALQFSKIQKRLFACLLKYLTVWVEWARRFGKTTCTASGINHRLINSGPLMKKGRLYIFGYGGTVGNAWTRFGELFLLLPFGQIDEIKNGGPTSPNFSINNLWIPLPKRYKEYISSLHDSEELEWWSDIIREIDGEIFVKYMKTDFSLSLSSSKKENYHRGILFNGAEISITAVNTNFQKISRGPSVYGLWVEELGLIEADLINSVIPALSEKRFDKQTGEPTGDGWAYFTFTPAEGVEAYDNWVYKRVVLPSEQYKGDTERYVRKSENGVEYYISGADQIDAYKAVFSKGKMSKCFHASHHGIKYIDGHLQKIEEVIKFKFNRNKEGELQYTDTGAIDMSFEYTGIQNPNSIYSKKSFLMEDELVWATSSGDEVFTNFSEKNIIDAKHKDYLLSNYKKFVGFDFGVGEVDESTNIVLAHNSSSVSVFVTIVQISEKQFVIVDITYVNADYRTIGERLFKFARKGYPVIYDNYLASKQGQSGGEADSKLKKFFEFYKPLINFSNNLIPCVKQKEVLKISMVNNLFKIDESLRHPINPELSGASLYILSDCDGAKEFFDECRYRGKDRKGDDYVDKDGNRQMKKIRTDVFDGIAYPIQTLFLDKDKKKTVDKFLGNQQLLDDKIYKPNRPIFQINYFR